MCHTFCICIIMRLTWTYVVDDLYLNIRSQLCAWAESTCNEFIIMHSGYGWWKYTIYDACRPCHSILSILKPVFRQIWLILIYNSLILRPRSPDLVIFMSMSMTMTTATELTDYFLPSPALDVLHHVLVMQYIQCWGRECVVWFTRQVQPLPQ